MGIPLHSPDGRKQWMLNEWKSGKYQYVERLIQRHIQKFKCCRNTAQKDWNAVREEAIAAQPYAPNVASRLASIKANA